MEELRQCQSCKRDFLIEEEDFAFYEKISVPAPTWCPECRLRRRLIFRNARKAFMRPDTHSGKLIFSGYPPRLTNQIYHVDYWKSDAWDALEYGREYAFNRDFFSQFRELWYNVPWSGQSVVNMVNSEYCDQAGYCRNAYLCFNGDAMEDSAYTQNSSYVKDCFDLLYCVHDELCCASVMVDHSYRTMFSVDCNNCSDVWFSRDLTGCSSCFACAFLRNKQYHIFNQPHTKEEYEKFITRQLDGTYSKFYEAFQKARMFWNSLPVKFYHGSKNQNSTGDRIENNKNARFAYNCLDAEDVKYVSWAMMGTKDSYDYSVWGNQSSLMYESQTCGEQANNIKFCFDCWPSIRNLEYCMMCRSSSDCFGCAGLKKKQFCIFNKQYSEDEYHELREKIIKQMDEFPFRDSRGRVYKYGEFYPPEFSPFAYNETMLHDLFPLIKDEAEAQGYKWEETPPREYQTTVRASDLPDSIFDVKEDISKEVIACEECGRAYRIITTEFQFHSKMKIPLPRQCIECRIRNLFQHANPPKFYKRKCYCMGHESGSMNQGGGGYNNRAEHFHGQSPCPNEFETSYVPDGPEFVYCEACYQNEIS